MLKQLFTAWSRKRLPQVNGRLYLPSLHQPVTIQRDKWGIPHIHAANRHDLFLAQGFVHAQDRLWQMELNRRAAKGTLSAVFGKLTLDTDRLSRTLGFNRLAHHNWAHFNGKARADLLAYTDGVNAYLAQQKPLPIEFSLVQHTPEPWLPVDSLAYGRLQMWALTHGAVGEWIYAQVLDKVGAKMGAELGMYYPDGNPITLSDGIDVQALNVKQVLETAVMPFHGKGSLDGAGRGSNGWVIDADKSSTGHAILCNDMHLPVGTPSLWHIQHLRSDDGFHATGFTQPGFPYVMVGHNDNISWGATLSYVDCEDLFVEKFHLTEPDMYQFKDEWRQAIMHEERIEIRGKGVHIETVVETHHGPLVHDILFSANTPSADAIALNSMALRPDVDMNGFGLLNEAAGWDEFVTAVSHIQSPSLNILYADVDDNIGHYVSGRVPVRAKGDGLLPAPGWAGTHEWIDTIPFAEMPHALNPKQGFIVSANNRITNNSYPHFLGNNWRNGFRANRIHMLISSKQKISIADCKRIHFDVLNQSALDLISHLPTNKPQQADAALSWELLTNWDGYLASDTIGGTVYQLFLTQLTDAILDAHFERPFLNNLLGLGPHPNMAPVNDFQGQWIVSLLKMLKQENSGWLPNGKAQLALMESCLANTTKALNRLLGTDPTQWQWGKLHQVTFAHAFGVQPPLNNIFNVGAFPVGGDTNTVAQTGIHINQPYHNNAISVSSRHIVHMANLSKTQMIHAPGQSGHLGSPHYDDLVPFWLGKGYVQMAWDETAVSSAAHYTLTLKPIS